MANYNPNSDSQSNNPLSNSVPQGVPDILQIGQPLDRQVDVEIETNLLDPVSHQFASPTETQRLSLNLMLMRIMK